jgi:REP element-mobilizing transposase RayT
MARGNHGQSIYKDDKDRRCFTETLAEACEKTGWKVHAYVLMANHYHLLITTPEPNLSDGMKWLQGTCTQRYNGRHKLFGHLFQGRYKALVMDPADRSCLQFVSTYIHLNPARAGLIRPGQQKLKRYHWSSYPHYLSLNCPGWLSRGDVLQSLGLTEEKRRGYEAYMEGRVLELGNKARREELEEQWRVLRRGWYLGEEKFLNKLKGWLEKAASGRQRQSHSGGAKRAHDVAAAEQLLARGLTALGFTEKDLEVLAYSAPEKVVLAWWLRKQTTVSLQWASERLKMGHYTRVTQAVSRMRRKPNKPLRTIARKLPTATE